MRNSGYVYPLETLFPQVLRQLSHLSLQIALVFQILQFWGKFIYIILLMLELSEVSRHKSYIFQFCLSKAVNKKPVENVTWETIVFS